MSTALTRRYIKGLRALYNETYKDLCTVTARKLSTLSKLPQHAVLVCRVYEFGVRFTAYAWGPPSREVQISVKDYFALREPWIDLKGTGVGDLSATTWRFTLIVAEAGEIAVYTTKKSVPSRHRRYL